MKEYKDVFPTSKEYAEQIFGSTDVERICQFYINLFFGDCHIKLHQ